jgi:hypothetical protein
MADCLNLSADQRTGLTAQVVNNLSERAIKLVTDFANSIIKDEEQKLLLLQIIEKHRQQIPDMKKETLKNI